MGGTTVQSDEDARAFAAAVLAHPKVWAEYGMEVAPQFRRGDELALEPCVDPPWYRRNYGRECPRVDLWPENGPAAGLVFGALAEAARPLFPAYVEAVVTDMPADAAADTVRRAFAALKSRPVADWRAATIAAALDKE